MSTREHLEVPQGDLDTHFQAGVLGAPLEAGAKMYIDYKTDTDKIVDS